MVGRRKWGSGAAGEGDSEECCEEDGESSHGEVNKRISYYSLFLSVF